MITYFERGTIIRISDKPGFWKVLKQRKAHFSEYMCYDCIKCTKTGKEYTYTNGFGVDWLHKNSRVVFVPTGK